MKLYLVRHGEALDETADPARPLSPRGREEVERVALFLRAAGIRLGHVNHSGKRRAQETAELLAEAVMPEGRVQSLAGIMPLDPVEPFVEDLEGWSADALVVGHLPFLGRALARLLCGDAEQELVAFPPAAVACLERGTRGWRLCWMVRPDVLP